MALLTHVASHPDALVSLLCDQLAVPPDDLFAPEIIAVPTRGIERWLTQRIASGLAGRGAGDGVCANIEFPSPRRLVRRVLLEVPELAASVAAWEGPTLTGHLVEAIDVHLEEPWMRVIARFLESPDGSDDPAGVLFLHEPHRTVLFTPPDGGPVDGRLLTWRPPRTGPYGPRS